MAVTYSDIKPLLDAGQTNAEIAASLLARRWTVKPIPMADLLDWLREEKVNGVPLGRFDAVGALNGLVVNVAADAATDPALKDGLDRLISHIQNSKAEQVSTHEKEYGVLLHNTALACGISSGQRASLYALGGGERFADATEAGVNAEINRHEREQAALAIGTRANEANEAAWAAYRAGSATAEITAAGEAAFAG